MKPVLLIVSILALGLLWSRCARNNAFLEPPDRPVIDSIHPAAGKKGTQLRLYGTGFSTSPSANKVSINGINVRVDSPSTSTTLLVTVTDSTGTGPVHIKVKGLESDGPIFTYLGNGDIFITKAAYGWADGSGYSVNVQNLPSQNNSIKLMVNGTRIPISYILRQGDPLYKPNEGEQLLVADDTTVENHVPLNFADFAVQGTGPVSNTKRLQVRPRVTDISPTEVVSNDVVTIAGKFFGDRSLPSGINLFSGGLLSPSPDIVSWTNNLIKIKLPSYPNITPTGGAPPGYAVVGMHISVGDMDSRLVTLYYKNTSGNITVTTVAGDGMNGFIDATGTAARFSGPTGIAIDGQGNIIVGDGRNNHRIRKINTNGQVTTIAGDPNGVVFNNPIGVALNSAGDVFSANNGNHKIMRVSVTGAVSVWAGSGTNAYGDGLGTNAYFSGPTGVAIDGNGMMYVADMGNHRIRKIDANRMVTTIAGGTAGFADGTGTAAKFYSPTGIAVDGNGNLYVADNENHRIRKITPAGVVTTLAGGSPGFADGDGAAAKFTYPRDVAVDGHGNVYVADLGNDRIRKITPDGKVTTLAGNGLNGYLDGPADRAQFNHPAGIAVTQDGATIYVGDIDNFRVRKITVQ